MLDGIIALVAGVLLLFYGKRLFWLAAALVAFLFGWQLFGNLLGPGLSLVLAAVLGIVFAWLAVKFVKIAAYIVGFLAGAVALPFLMGIFGVESWFILALIGGAIGLILVAVAFDWGLILITAWAGASAISFALQNWVTTMSGTFSTVVFLVLMVVGVFWQASRRRKG